MKILQVPEWGSREDGTGKVLLDAECERRALGRAMAVELRRLFGSLGERGYREKWVNHDFPTARLAAIEELLRRGGA